MITLMANCGFCDGVRHAVESTEKQHESILNGTPVFLYGDLVNNTHVMLNFINKGFYLVDSEQANATDLIPDGATVIIRAHGISREIEEKLIAKNAIIKDYTCGRVKKVHKIVEMKSSEGYKIIVVGNKRHPEVIGIVGWSSSPALVVKQETDLEGIDVSGKVCIVAQTTCDVVSWETIINRICSINPSAEIHNTLCGVIEKREEKAKEVAASCDVMFVIGDSNSSNSKRLFNQCRSVNKNTFPITSLFTLNPVPESTLFNKSLCELEKDSEVEKIIQCSSSIGLTASASSPDNVISETRDYLMFKEFMMKTKKEIEYAFKDYFEDYCSNAPDNVFVQSSLKSLWEQNEGGKRIRGAMIKLGEKIASGDNNYLPVAVGYELFQTSVLIHDDIIDNGDTRRNKATIHIESQKNIKRVIGVTDDKAKHYGISRAICIGDYGFFMSYQFLSKCKVDDSALMKVYNLYSKILTITCEGEIMDSLLPFDRISIIDNYEEYKKIVTQIYEYKTAWYTLAGPIMLGALCGGASSKLIELLKSITIPLGIAFQIKDDILGIYSSEEVLGKSVLSDIQENKQTLMFGFAYKNANSQQKTLLDYHYGKEDANKNDLEAIRKLFVEIGAKEYAENEIQRLSNLSKSLISNELIGDEFQSILNGLINYLIGRNF